MPIQWGERVTSRSATGNSLKVKFLAFGETSTFEIRSAIAADTVTFPPQNGVSPTLWINYSGITIEQVEGCLDVFEVTVPWEHPTKKSQQDRREERADYSWTWELRGRVETAHITRSFRSRVKKPGVALADSTMKLIGYDKATGEIRGADVPVHATELAVSFYMPAALFTLEFQDQVENAYDHLNTLTFLGRAPGRVLFVDANFGSDNENYQNVKCDYTFLLGRSVTVPLEVVGDVVVPPHWILDVWTKEIEDPDPEIGLRSQPTVAFVHCPFEEKDLSFLMPTAPSEPPPEP